MYAPCARAAAAFFLLAILPPAPSGAAGPAPIPARALVDSLAAHYAALAAYHFEGVARVTMAPDTGDEPNVTETPFLFAARWPSRVHNEIQSTAQPVTFIADGDSLAVIAPMLNQYVVQKAPHIVPGQPPTGEYDTALQPLAGIARLGTRLLAASDLGPDTVLTASGIVNCRKLRLEYAPDSTMPGVTMQPRTLWVEPVSRVLWRDEVSLRVDPPGRPGFTNRQTTRFVIADLSSGGPDSLYRISPPEGVQRVSRLGPPPPPPRAIVGKQAPDFTLATLAGRKVHLAELRGKVVVLDFWATWCGPCRRWMPVVAKLEKELHGRDVRFYAVNERDTPAKVRAFLASTGITVPVLLDPEGSAGTDYDASSIPLTIIVGRDGKVVDALLGLRPEEELRAALRKAGVTGI